MHRHLQNTSNPHKVTAAQVGLDKVKNVTTNDQTPTYTAASTLVGLTSGEKLSVAFGKISRAITDLISHLGNRSNPHKVTASQAGARAENWLPTPIEIGAAPSGYGYGESLMAYSAETEEELETKLLEIINTMSNYTTRQVRFTLGFTKVTSYYLATIFKHTSGYSLVTFRTMRLYGATLIKPYSNGWLPLQWENPPMEEGTEYCTTERHNGKAVYVTRLIVGELLNKGVTQATLPSDPTEIVELYGTVKSNAYNEELSFPLVTLSGAIGGRLYKTSTRSISVKTFADYSGYTATATVKYTKD